MDIADKLSFWEAKRPLPRRHPKTHRPVPHYISRIENGFTVPSIETLEKITRARNRNVSALLRGGNATAPLTTPDGTNKWLFRRIGRNYLRRMTHALSKMSGRDRAVLLNPGICARAQRQTQPKSQSRPAEQKINQEEAAERCGLHRTYYSGVERGVRNVSPVNIEKIARAAALGG